MTYFMHTVTVKRKCRYSPWEKWAGWESVVESAGPGITGVAKEINI